MNLLIDCPHCHFEVTVPANVETKCPRCRLPVIAEAPVMKAQAKKPKAAQASPWMLAVFLLAMLLAFAVLFLNGFSLDGGFVATVCATALGCAIYFIPTFIASQRNVENSNLIFVLNLLMGVTIIGWVAAFIWAAVDKPKAA